jgi:ABC-type transport system involved in cytochrome bd biosynthesis fused ATPase/permease subunit
VIHVLDGGGIVESGTHDELVTRAGAYASLWAVQTGAAVRREPQRPRPPVSGAPPS